MIRKVIKTKNNRLTLSIPDHYIGKEVEAIAFTLDEPVKQLKKNCGKRCFQSIKA